MGIFSKKTESLWHHCKRQTQTASHIGSGELFTPDDADVKKRYDKSCGKIHTC